jgi:hypothetical protein
LESSLRAVIALLLALTVAACDKPKPTEPQAEAAKEPIGRVDVSARGSDMPAIPFVGRTAARPR